METEWTAVCLSDDLPAGVVVPGHAGGVDLAVWRSATGRVAAWVDRCPHRGMRLSHGFVRGETLACIYHGWSYGSDGGCLRIPAHPALVPPATIRATGMACAEDSGLIWVAPEGTATPLPALEGLSPVRSLGFDLAEAALGLDGFIRAGRLLHGTPVITGRPTRLALVLQPLPEGTMMHALADPDAPKPAVSRWLEVLRQTLEAVA